MTKWTNSLTDCHVRVRRRMRSCNEAMLDQSWSQTRPCQAGREDNTDDDNIHVLRISHSTRPRQTTVLVKTIPGKWQWECQLVWPLVVYGGGGGGGFGWTLSNQDSFLVPASKILNFKCACKNASYFTFWKLTIVRNVSACTNSKCDCKQR